MNIFKLIPLLTSCLFIASCDDNPEIRIAKTLIGDQASEGFKIIKLIKRTKPYGGLAIFAHLPKKDFEIYKKNSKLFRSWETLKNGIIIVNDDNTLSIPEDLNGICSIEVRVDEGAALDEETGKLRRCFHPRLITLVVWDESTETIVFLLAEGVAIN